MNQKSSGTQHGLSCKPKFGFEQLAADGGQGSCCFQTNLEHLAADGELPF